MDENEIKENQFINLLLKNPNEFDKLYPGVRERVEKYISEQPVEDYVLVLLRSVQCVEAVIENADRLPLVELKIKKLKEGLALIDLVLNQGYDEIEAEVAKNSIADKLQILKDSIEEKLRLF